MKTKDRFTLRKEYFGGIVHDTKAMACHILDKTEFETLKLISAGYHEVYFSIREFYDTGIGDNFVTKLSDMGILTFCSDRVCVSGVRLVELPVPDGCLTAPIRIYHSFTRKCNLKCPQCCIASEADTKDDRMTLEEFEKVVRKFYEAGTMEWRFTGGEATACSDFLDANSICKKYGMATMLNSNGCWSDQTTEKVLHAGFSEIIISLEGGKDINDLRRPGAYPSIIKIFERIFKHNSENPADKIRVTVNMTVAKDNVGEVEFVVRLGAKYGYNVNFVPLRPYGRTPVCLPEKMLSTEEFMEFSKNVQKLREDMDIKRSGIRIIHRNMDLFNPGMPDKSKEPAPFDYSDCGALATGFGLCPDGRVNVCSFMMDDSEFFGPNMKEVSVQKAWLHPSMELFRRAKKIGCPECRYYKKQCEGKCRAMVLAEGGEIINNELIGNDRYCFAGLMPK